MIHNGLNRLGRWIPACAIMTILLLVGLGNSTYAGTLLVDSSKSYKIATSSWGTGGLPVQPSAEWQQFCNGLDYDTLADGTFPNDGSLTLVNGLKTLNAPAVTEGILDDGQRALKFDGVTTVCQAGDELDIDTTQGFSVNIFLRYTSSGTMAPLAKRNAYSLSYNKPGWIFYTISGSIYFEVHSDSFRVFRGSLTAINDGKWHSVLASLWQKDAGAICSLYVDGVYSGRDSSATIWKNVGAANVQLTTLGARSNLAHYFNGDIGCVQIWSTTSVTSAQQLAIYNAMMPTGTVAKPYPSIQSAIRMATNGSKPYSILVALGTYRETVEIANDSISISALYSTYPNRPVILGSGLPASAGTIGLLNIASYKPAVNYLDVRGFSTGIGVKDSLGGSSGTWRQLTIDSCLIGYWASAGATTDSLNNVTIDGAGLASSYGIYASTIVAAKTLYCYNTTISTDTETGIGISRSDNWTITLDYCNFFGNSLDTFSVAGGSGFDYGTHNISQYPQFNAVSLNDYRLKWSSPLARRGLASAGLGYIYIGAYGALSSQQAGIDSFGRPAFSRNSFARKGFAR